MNERVSPERTAREQTIRDLTAEARRLLGLWQTTPELQWDRPARGVMEQMAAALDELAVALDAETARADEAERHEQRLRGEAVRRLRNEDALAARLEQAREALQRIKDQQPKTLAMIERNGFVFEDIGCELGNWQQLAFTIYTNLCEVDTWAEQALAALASPKEPPNELAKIERTLRHAEATRRTMGDSWLNAYQDDVRWLVTKLRDPEPRGGRWGR